MSILNRLIEQNKEFAALAAVDFLILSKEKQHESIELAAAQIEGELLSTLAKIDSLHKELSAKHKELYRLQDKMNGLKQLSK